MHKKWIWVVSILLGVGVALVLYQFLALRSAHSSFDNYYKFRGCQTLISKTDTEGTCRLKDGQVITIVKYQGRWFLRGDLPGGFLSW